MGKIVHKLLILCVTIIACLPLLSNANTNIQAVTELFYPYQEFDEHNQLTGYSVDVVNALASVTKDEVDIDLLPWSVAYNTALVQPNVMIFSIGKNSKRDKLFKWVGRLAKEELYFWALPNSKVLPSENLADFKPFTITVVKEATTHQYLRDNGFENLYVMGGTESNASEENRVQMVINGRADIVIANQRSMDGALKLLGYSNKVLVRVFRASSLDSDLYIAFGAKSDDHLVQRYRQAFNSLESSGQLQKLKAKWNIY